MSDRRTKDERRRTSERRRASTARRFAVEICHAQLRAAILIPSENGENMTVKTRVVNWRENATRLHSETAFAELTTAFRRLVVEEKMGGGRLRVALGGEFCVTRVISGAEEAVRRETTLLEERSQRYLSLGAGAKAIAGNIQQLDARHQHALVTISNQGTLDLLARVADAVNVKIEIVEPSLVALSRLVAQSRDFKDEPIMVIHLDANSSEVGVCFNEMLLLGYSPGGQNTTNNVGDIVRQHLPRLQRYSARNYAFVDKPIRHVLLSGDREFVRSAAFSFESANDLVVQPLECRASATSFTFSSDTPGCEFGPVVGTAMTFCAPFEENPGPNLMENLIALAKTPMRPILIRSFLPVAAVLLLAAFLACANYRQTQETNKLKADFNVLAPLQAKTNELRLNLQFAEHRLRNLERLEKTLGAQPLADSIGTIGRCMPEDVWLQRLTISDGRSIELDGESFADSGIYEFARWLKKAPGMADVVLDGTRAGQTPTGTTTQFAIKLALEKWNDYENHENNAD